MNESFECECGNYEFWLDMKISIMRCSKCYAEYKSNSRMIMQRKFNKNENNYPEKWDVFRIL